MFIQTGFYIATTSTCKTIVSRIFKIFARKKIIFQIVSRLFFFSLTLMMMKVMVMSHSLLTNSLSQAFLLVLELVILAMMVIRYK